MRTGTFALWALLAGGCTPSATSLSSHTVQAGPSQEVDVVWIQKGGKVYRCTGRGERPVCELVPTD